MPQAFDNGCYEGFEDLVDRANAWLKDKNSVTVTNMQSIMVLKDDSKISILLILYHAYYSEP